MLRQGRAIYSRFRELPGSRHIAKPAAIAALIKHIRRARPRSILEVGSGIGTLTYTILATLRSTGHRARVVTVEDNEFCLDALRRNLGDQLSEVELRTSVADLSPRSFDFLIVDGGTLERGGYIELLAPNGHILVEGGRGNQRDAMWATDRECVMTEIWPGRVEDGGYWLIKAEPTAIDRLRSRLGRFWVKRIVPQRWRMHRLLARLGIGRTEP